MQLKLIVDPLLINWGAPDEVVADRCSICEAVFGEDDVPLCMWTAKGWAARLCDACVKKHLSFKEAR